MIRWRIAVCTTILTTFVSGSVVLAQPRGPSQSPSSTPFVSSLSPLVVRAGVGDECTFIGAGFGTADGASVEVTSAFSAGTSFSAVPANHIVLWSDTMVVFRIPATPTIVAGSGQVRLRLANGTILHAPLAITVQYGIYNAEAADGSWLLPRLASNATDGSFMFHVGSGMTEVHVKALRRALTTWRCATGLRLDVSSQPAVTTCSAADGISTIGFDLSACRLPSSQAVDVAVYYESCGSGTTAGAHISEADIVLNELLPWNNDIEVAEPQMWDLETVFVHAIGRALGFTVNRNARSVMSETAPRIGVTQRTLESSSDSSAGVLLHDHSTTEAACSSQRLHTIAASTCSISAPLATFTASKYMDCGSLAVRFSTSSPYNPTSIQWDFDNNGTWDATSSTPEFTYSTPGNYTVRLRVANVFGVDERVYPNAIVVHPKPRADAGSDQTVCAGTSLRLGGTSPASGTQAPYITRWTPSRFMDDSTRPNPTVRVYESTTFVLTVTDARNCISSDTVVISTNEAPVVRIDGDTAVCKGHMATVRANIATGFPPFQFSWSGHSGLVGASSQSPRFFATETTQLTVLVTDARGCTSTEKIIIAVATQTPPVITAPMGTFACQGASVPLTATTEDALEVEWNTGARSPSIAATSSGTYSVRAKNTAGCWSEWQSIKVTIGKAPEPSIDGVRAICGDTSTKLTAFGDYVAYKWSHGPSTAEVVIDSPGRYGLQGLHSTGCWSDEVFVDVVAGVAPEKPTIERIDDVLRAVGGDAWQWYVNQARIEGATSATYTVTSSGHYAVASVGNTGCQTLSDVMVVDVVMSVAYNPTLLPLTIVPNPASLHVTVSWAASDVHRVRLLDAFGRTVLQADVAPGNTSATLNLDRVVPGWYMVQLSNPRGDGLAGSQAFVVHR
jgi:PKD repeat protein